MPTAVILRKQYEFKDDQFRFTLKADNGKIIAVSELYKNKADVKKVLNRYFPNFEVRDLTGYRDVLKK